LILSVSKFFFKLELDVEQLINYPGVKLLQVLVGNVVDPIDLVRVLRIYFLLGIVLIFSPISFIFLSNSILRATLKIKRRGI
jgi:hypothetical protein